MTLTPLQAFSNNGSQDGPLRQPRSRSQQQPLSRFMKVEQAPAPAAGPVHDLDDGAASWKSEHHRAAAQPACALTNQSLDANRFADAVEHSSDMPQCVRAVSSLCCPALLRVADLSAMM